MSGALPTSGITRRTFLTAASAAMLSACGRTPRRPDYDCDVCIIGSGFAGLFLAQRLADRGARVMVLEAGPRLARTDAAGGMTSLFPATSRGTLAFPIDGTRTIGIGGTSRVWNGVVTRLLPDDFLARTRRGLHTDWPVTYDELADYYCQAERLLQVSGGSYVEGAEPPRCTYPSEFSDDVSPAGVLGRPDLPVFPLAFALVDGRPLRLDEGPIERLRATSNITLLDRHPVTRLELDASGMVVSVEARTADDRRVVIHPRFTVVAAGTVETTRLLLHTRAAHDVSLGGTWLGAGFNAHPRYRIQVRPRAGLPRIPHIHRSNMRGPGHGRGSGAFVADFHLDSSAPQVDVTLELSPDVNNTIRLDPNRADQWGRPRVVLNADWTRLDLETRLAALAAQQSFARALGQPTAPPALRWFHPAGSCRMGSSPESGVVDAQLCVFGTSNLFLSGSAVFPCAGAANPTLTIVALSLRLADRISKLIEGPDRVRPGSGVRD